ncbi:MAG TPA: hypothetical protein ENN80_06320 [Candidatus Hydrogenedentes bacterium]|nr:hypothetical protein [Candidatus Hydrogenedentota bacterium]
MDATIGGVNAQQLSHFPRYMSAQATEGQEKAAGLGDILDIGGKGPLSREEAMAMVLERTFAKLRAAAGLDSEDGVGEGALAKLRGVVNQARAALGIPEGVMLDTSPEATAGRIADFALGAFDKWLERHPGLAEDEAREQFALFIGGAISQGIEEARGILSALQALTPQVNQDIDTTWGIIQERLQNFVHNGL